MSVQVLVASMNQQDQTLLDKMNIQSDAIIGNQCSFNKIESFKYKGHNVTYLSFNERGVGLNRNNCLMRATADYSVIADDDMEFYDNYPETVEKAFKEQPKADFLIFNIDEDNDSGRRKNTKYKKVNIFNYLNYGAARFVYRTDVIHKKGISFNLQFGGGTNRSCGEDSLFLRECLRKKVRVYTAGYSIAHLIDQRESSWFKGYNDKFFNDEGYLLGIAHPLLCKLFALYIAYSYSKNHGCSFLKTFKILKQGIKEAKGKR